MIWISLFIVTLFCITGVYAPFLASSKPFFVIFNGSPYFPLFRYLFFNGFFTKNIDLFFNLLMFTLPFFFFRKTRIYAFFFQLAAFAWLISFPISDPTHNLQAKKHHQLQQESKKWTWENELSTLSPYAKLDIVLKYFLEEKQQKTIKKYVPNGEYPTRWHMRSQHIEQKLQRASPDEIAYIEARESWLTKQELKWLTMPLIRNFHWEEDAGGSQSLNQELPWWELTRINRKDLVASLIFGIRISLVVGFISVGLALLIGVPFGAVAGYYGGKFDILLCRLLEVWESMPVLFMLLLTVSILQSKSIFLVIAVIGLFGWTSFSRYIRGEFLKQRKLPYVDACRTMRFRDRYIIFTHILPNAIPPLLTLLPFAMMAAITSEAGLSFLGLGEEGSCSWGVLMDEGRQAFPGESYLLWPPALLLTLLLIAIALVGDALRDRLDPRTES